MRERFWTRGETYAVPMPAVIARTPPRPPGFDFVLRRLVGVLFLTPALVLLGLGQTLLHLLNLTFRPGRTRETLFTPAQGWRKAARFAYYDDFARPHAVALVTTATAYLSLWQAALNG